jgi:hypothetical protein
MVTVVILVVVGVAFLAAFVALHWYVWRRLVRDTTIRRTPLRRVGTVVFIAGPVLGLAAVRDDMPGIPFAFEGIIDWPGYMCLALFLYLLLALAVGELLRPVLRWWLARRDNGSTDLAAPPDGKRQDDDPVAAVPLADQDQGQRRPGGDADGPGHGRACDAAGGAASTRLVFPWPI